MEYAYGNIPVENPEQFFVGDENPPDTWRECGCCGGYHPPDYFSECRDDRFRWPSRFTGGV